MCHLGHSDYVFLPVGPSASSLIRARAYSFKKKNTQKNNLTAGRQPKMYRNVPLFSWAANFCFHFPQFHSTGKYNEMSTFRLVSDAIIRACPNQVSEYALKRNKTTFPGNQSHIYQTERIQACAAAEWVFFDLKCHAACGWLPCTCNPTRTWAAHSEGALTSGCLGEVKHQRASRKSFIYNHSVEAAQAAQRCRRGQKTCKQSIFRRVRNANTLSCVSSAASSDHAGNKQTDFTLVLQLFWQSIYWSIIEMIKWLVLL